MKRYLLDTNIFLWMFLEPHKVPVPVKAVLDVAPPEHIFFSPVSAWEIAIKYGRDKLAIPQPPKEYVCSRLRATGFAIQPIELVHTLTVHELPPHHKDPFDRILIAQALQERMTLLTGDRVFSRYTCPVIGI